MTLVLRIVMVATLCVSLSSCMLRSVLPSPSIQASVQAGEGNLKTIGQSNTSQQKVTRSTVDTVRQSADKLQVKSETVQKIVINEIPLIHILIGAFLLIVDSPKRWPGQIAEGFKTARNRKRSSPDQSRSYKYTIK